MFSFKLIPSTDFSLSIKCTTSYASDFGILESFLCLPFSHWPSILNHQAAAVTPSPSSPVSLSQKVNAGTDDAWRGVKQGKAGKAV